MRILRLLLAPLTIILRLLLRPLALLLRQRAAGDGWIELTLEGEVREYPPPRATLIRRLMRARDDSPRVVLSQLERLAREVARDPRARGVLVRLGPLGGGWATTLRVRRALGKIRDSGKKVVVYVTHYTGNREYAVATAGTTILTVPPAVLAPAGSSSSTLFLGETLARAGIKIEVASAGRYKSAPDALTRTTRSEADREQTTALVRAMDAALEEAVAEGRKIDLAAARAAIDGAPYTGMRARDSGLTDGVARDDELPQSLKELDGLAEVPELVDGADYLGQRILRPIVRMRRPVVGIVQCHGAIVDRMNPYLGMTETAAVEKVVVSDLRAALADRSVAAVVLHVDSRGGSVIASDAIYAAVKRLDAEKPVIACFGDVSASGGYYVACGARAIVASPLTVTGSIGVFGMMPTWPGLGERLSVHPDSIAFHTHATMADPWRPRTEEERAHAQAEVEALYREFITLVAAARSKTVEEVDALAQGRVWIGSDAAARGLVDGLGGLEEAIERAQTAARAGGKAIRFAEDPRVVRAKKPVPRPAPVPDKAAAALAIAAAAELAGLDPTARALVLEALALRASAPWSRAWVWAPVAPG